MLHVQHYFSRKEKRLLSAKAVCFVDLLCGPLLEVGDHLKNPFLPSLDKHLERVDAVVCLSELLSFA